MTIDWNQRFDKLRKSKNVPGFAAAWITKKTRASVVTGYRQISSDVECEISDKWHIGSLTKSMTATLAAILVEQNYFNWSASIGSVLDEDLRHVHEDWKRVTLNQLLAHHGGIPAEIEPAIWQAIQKRVGSATEQRKLLAQMILEAPPPDAVSGQTYVYSNAGYAIAGLMIEKILGDSWENLMQTRLFAPLGMNTAGFGAPGIDGQLTQPRGHQFVSGKLSPVQPGPLADNPPAIAPGAVVHCSIEDLLTFVAEHLYPGKLFQTEQALLDLHQPYGTSDYNHGWVITNREWSKGEVLHHSGSNTLWYATIWAAPTEKSAFVTACNAATPAAEQLCGEVTAQLIRHYLTKK